MNVPVDERIEQIVINLDRAKWFIDHNKGRIITVNIPEFVLRSTIGDSIEMAQNVVVGKEGTNTTMFTGKLNQVVFSPYWNIPYGITKNEILPGINRGAMLTWPGKTWKLSAAGAMGCQGCVSVRAIKIRLVG